MSTERLHSVKLSSLILWTFEQVHLSSAAACRLSGTVTLSFVPPKCEMAGSGVPSDWMAQRLRNTLGECHFPWDVKEVRGPPLASPPPLPRCDSGELLSSRLRGYTRTMCVWVCVAPELSMYSPIWVTKEQKWNVANNVYWMGHSAWRELLLWLLKWFYDANTWLT